MAKPPENAAELGILVGTAGTYRIYKVGKKLYKVRKGGSKPGSARGGGNGSVDGEADFGPLNQERRAGDGASMSSEAANRPHLAEGRYAPYAKGTRARDFVTKKDRAFVRVHGEGNQPRSFMMRPHEIRGLSASQIKNKFALPEEPAYISDVHVPAGTKVRAGRVAEQKGWGRGGAIQYELREKLPKRMFRNRRGLE